MYGNNTPQTFQHYSVDGVGGWSSRSKAGAAKAGVTYQGFEATIPTMMNALGRVPFKPLEKAFVIADYGAADGGTSMFLMTEAIEWLKKNYGPNQEIVIQYEDQAFNDFKSLFLRMNGTIPDPPSYLRKHQDVFVTACGTGFYSQCFPMESVHVAFSSLAVQWLSTRLPGIPDAIDHLNSKSTEHIERYAQQFQKDWERFLLLRAKELVPGGQLVLMALFVNDEGQYSGNTKYIKENMRQTMNHYWKQMRHDGTITQEEFTNCTFQHYYPTRAEYSAAFVDPSASVPKAGLSLVGTKEIIVRCPFHNEWQHQQANQEPVKEQAHLYVEGVRAWSNHVFESALSETRPEAERANILDRLYQNYENEIVASPSDHGQDLVLLIIHIEKAKTYKRV